ncbi:MAG: flagellar assembly protein FliX [Alphaproteobacteria bacterium]|nr:flagellar assembly protein FliX [Alphaproteobacteria bacterium]MBL7097642.1 flagellar assembly protein FliX [Alphaproteobacteria bacterium]
MEINGPRKIDSVSVRRVAKTTTGGTSSTFSVSDPAEVRGSVVAGPGPIGALDSILMLQGLDESTDGRSKGLAHGEKLLDMLDEVRDGLLAGGVPRTTLNRLANAVTRRHDQFNDPKLQGVLDEIELRAHVELAKLEMMDKRVA